MRKTKSMRLVLSVMALLTVIGCSDEPKIKTVLNPIVADCNVQELSVDKVILTDSMTIIDFSYEIGEDGGNVSVSPTSYITVGGKKYNIIGTKNIPMCAAIQTTIYNRTVTYSLIFPAIPFDTDSISFYDDWKYEYESDEMLQVKGIDLTGEAKSIAYKDKKDSELYASKMEEIYAHPSFSSMDDYDEPDIQTTPEPEPKYNYYCPRCQHLIQTTKSNAPRPNSGNCTNGYHQWYCYGKVGNHLYVCSHCGLEVYAQDRPDNSGCFRENSGSSTHLWQNIN